MMKWGRKLGGWARGFKAAAVSGSGGLFPPQKKSSAVAGLTGGASKAAFFTFASPRWTGRTYEQLAREGYRKNVIVNRCVRIIAESTAAVPLLIFRGDKKLSRHPALDLLMKPNPLQSGKELLAGFYAYLEIAGNSYLELVTGADGKPGELYVLRPERMKVVPGPNGWPARYEYKVGGKSHSFPVDGKTGKGPILHLRNFNPEDDHYGLSALEPSAFAVGIGVPEGRIDWQNIITEANICDETVSLNGGGSEKRYTCNGIIDPQLTHRQNLEILSSSMAGTVVFQAGVWRVFAGAPRTAVKTRGTNHLAGPINLRAKKGISERINSVKGIYLDEPADFERKDYPPQQNSTYITQDNGLELWQDLDLPMTTSGTMAQRIAKITLERARREKQLDLTFFPIALQDQAMDAVNFTYAPFNISNEKFLIADWSLKFEKDDNGNIGFLINEILVEEDDSIYSWTPSTDEKDIPVTGLAPSQDRINDQRALPPVNVAGGLVSVDPNPLSAVDAGAAARIDIAQHTRHFGFGNVTYNSGSISSLNFETQYFVFADDPGLNGGNVTYQATTTKTVVTDSNDRLFIGEITTPADGGGSTSGTGGGGFLGGQLD